MNLKTITYDAALIAKAKEFEALASSSRKGTMAACITSLRQALEVLEAENRELRKRLGESCEDEGCPHYGTKHSHTEP